MTVLFMTDADEYGEPPFESVSVTDALYALSMSSAALTTNLQVPDIQLPDVVSCMGHSLTPCVLVCARDACCVCAE